MKKGYLSSHFESVAVKILSQVEANPNKSNQHEFNGVSDMKRMFGTPPKGEPNTFPAKFLFLNDDEPVTSEGFVTWYESRGDWYPKNGKEKQRYRSEYRLYFPTTNVSINASAGDLLVVAKCQDGSILVIIAEAGTTIFNQVEWLFGIHPSVDHPGFSVREELETEQDRLSFTSRVILETIGVYIDDTEETFLEKMLERFDGAFPDTKSFSTFARSTLEDIDPLECPDAAIMAWMEREEILFRTLERYLIAERLHQGFVDAAGNIEPEGFFSFSLSIQNRRKSRAGYALENHLEELFHLHKIRYDRGKVTEIKSKPDFLFPGQKEYKDAAFPEINLTMLGVKTTCKDRWRQVLAEANRIREKHLLTLEPKISTNQTEEMRTKKIRLVLPLSLHETYTSDQRTWLMNIREFIELVRSRQAKK